MKVMSKTVANKNYKNTGNNSVLNSIPSDAKIVLDIGCGAGDNARMLKYKGIIVDGITLSHEEAELAKEYCRKVIIHNLEYGLPAELIENQYDAIICSHVLEHICWPEKLLADTLKIVSRSKCYLIVALPNIMEYRYRIELVKGNFNYTETGAMDTTHFRWYTFTTGRDLLLKNGFTEVNAWVDISLPLKSIVGKILPLSFQNFLKKVLFRISPGFFGGQLLYKASIKK